MELSNYYSNLEKEIFSNRKIFLIDNLKSFIKKEYNKDFTFNEDKFPKGVSIVSLKENQSFPNNYEQFLMEVVIPFLKISKPENAKIYTHESLFETHDFYHEALNDVLSNENSKYAIIPNEYLYDEDDLLELKSKLKTNIKSLAGLIRENNKNLDFDNNVKRIILSKVDKFGPISPIKLVEDINEEYGFSSRDVRMKITGFIERGVLDLDDNFNVKLKEPGTASKYWP